MAAVALCVLMTCACDREHEVPDDAWRPVLHDPQNGVRTLWSDLGVDFYMAPRPSDGELTPSTRIAAPWAYVGAFGLVQGPLALALAFSLAMALRLALRGRAEREASRRTVLRNGERVVSGIVQTDGDDRPFISVTLHQDGRERRDKSGRTQVWVESFREMAARPFEILCDDGSRVRVEPDDALLLQRDLDRIERLERTKRLSIAELTAGARVHVRGILSAAGERSGIVYRDAARLPTLRAPADRNLTVSTEPPGVTNARRARGYAVWSLFFAVSLLAAVAVENRFDRLAFAGHTVLGMPTSVARWEEWRYPVHGSPERVTLHAVRARARLGASVIDLEDLCSDSAAVAADHDDAFPFRVLPNDPTVYRIGAGPSITVAEVASLSMFVLFVLLAFGVFVRREGPWYLRRRVVQTQAGAL